MYKYVIGIDEVGRGSLAGPVTVAALALQKKFIRSIRLRQLADGADKNKKLKTPLRDSKKLFARQREIWFDFVKKQKIPYVIASISPKVIDKINISNAANLAASRALLKLIKSHKLKIKNFKVRLDGGLYINNPKFKNQNAKLQFKNIKIKTVIKGDEKIKAISLASIVAKVSRDRYMKKLHKKYPRYDFINNIGYGTKKHIKAIKKYGLSLIHRKSFKV